MKDRIVKIGIIIFCLLLIATIAFSSFWLIQFIKILNKNVVKNGEIEKQIEAEFPNASIQLSDNTFIYQGKLYEYTTDDDGINHIYETNKKIVK